MNILVKKLNINGTAVNSFGAKVTKKEARANGFEPGKQDAFTAVCDYNGNTYMAFGYDFQDAVSTMCKEIQSKIKQ